MPGVLYCSLLGAPTDLLKSHMGAFRWAAYVGARGNTRLDGDHHSALAAARARQEYLAAGTGEPMPSSSESKPASAEGHGKSQGRGRANTSQANCGKTVKATGAKNGSSSASDKAELDWGQATKEAAREEGQQGWGGKRQKRHERAEQSAPHVANTKSPKSSEEALERQEAANQNKCAESSSREPVRAASSREPVRVALRSEVGHGRGRATLTGHGRGHQASKNGQTKATLATRADARLVSGGACSCREKEE